MTKTGNFQTLSKHYNLYTKKGFVGTVLCKPCCVDGFEGPKVEKRCKISYHERKR
jgi:hypothetical protein